MKGLNLFLAMCFAVPTFDGAWAAIATNTPRNQANNTRHTQNTNGSARNSSNIKSRNIQNTTARNVINKNVVSRTQNTISRTGLSTHNIAINNNTNKKTNLSSRSALSPIRSSRNNTARSAITTRQSVLQRDFSKCKNVFFECMDEFCANKDTQLKRCACSTRANNFSETQKSLSIAQDKLSDFSQRLLHVNMDPDDAAVINTATDGENAYYATRDNSSSKKTLDAIAEKLNTSFDSSNNNMSALSWSLDINAAFDSIDSTGGISTSAKSGTALLNAALPVCREMATEVCSADDLSLVETSYNMVIEQDCNTVQRSFETQTQQVRTQILDSSALLDMTRLNKYQSDNSDDILTCKSKMLDMLTNTNICGENLTKCLDISGRYINPTTGEVFLSSDLINITTLITRPASSDTWANIPNNAPFVSYLNNKKKYIEPATQNCQTIADDLWNSFIEDALSQIKLAQNAKLEQVRKSCSTLLSECLDNATTNLQEFDSRALSTFGVITDKTVNALCENVRTSCNAIMNYTGDDSLISTTSSTSCWETGVNEIATNETYSKILKTCREIGQNCIINSCTSINGNFGLCQDINESINRHSILTRAACWDDVYNCVAQADSESITNIYNMLSANYGNNIQDFYEQNYTTSLNTYIASNTNSDRLVYDICTDQYNTNPISYNTCRITEQIWGNCKSQPNTIQNNPILIPDNYPENTTLLAWFAKNTYTDTNINSCSTSICPVGTSDYTIGTSTMCVAPTQIVTCPSEIILCRQTLTTPNKHTNCCPSETLDSVGNCCMDGNVTNGILFSWTGMAETGTNAITNSTKICTPNSNTPTMTMVAKYTDNNTTTHYIFCAGDIKGGSDTEIHCDGTYLELIKPSTSNYYYATITPNTNNTANYTYSVNYFINADKSNTQQYCNTTNTETSTNDWPNPNHYQQPTGKWLITF